MERKRAVLGKTMSGLDIFGLSFGAMIGWGWVVFASDWIRMGGTIGAGVAFVVGGLMCIAVGLVYAELTSALPVAGGPVAFSYRGLGETWGWAAGWIVTLSYLSVAAFETVAVISALNYIIPFPQARLLWTVAGEPVYLSWALAGTLLSLSITYINVRGTKLSTAVQTAGTMILLAAGVFFLVVAFSKGSATNFEPLWVSPAGTMAVAMMVPFMMVGFDVIPQSAEEANVPYRKVGQLLVLSVVSAALWYLLIVFGLGYAVPAGQRDSSQLAVCSAIEILLRSPFWGKVVAVGGVCGILTSWNAFLMAASRVLFSMGRAGMLPEALGRVDERRGVPANAVLMSGAICTIAPFFGRKALVWLADVGGLCTCVTYLIVSLSFLKLRKTEPDLARPYRAGKTKAIGVISVAVTSLFLLLYLPIGPSSLVWPYEWGLVLSWALLGLGFARMTKRNVITMADRDKRRMMFGDI